MNRTLSEIIGGVPQVVAQGAVTPPPEIPLSTQSVVLGHPIRIGGFETPGWAKVSIGNGLEQPDFPRRYVTDDGREWEVA